MNDSINYGIDLGTTNSCIACCDAGNTRIFQSKEMMNVTPSVVQIHRTGRIYVGRRAYEAWCHDVENTQAEFKRWMGNSDTLKFPASGREMTAPELSGEILKALKDDVFRMTGVPIDAAVITTPAAFGQLQCEATAKAAQFAGFKHYPLLQEPIAAAIAYGAEPGLGDQRWLVFDFGGGTFDCAVVSTASGKLTVLEHQGDNHLGGKDIDDLIVRHFLLPELEQQFSLPTPDEDPDKFRLLIRLLQRAAEMGKIVLSTMSETEIDLTDLGDDLDDEPIETTVILKRSDLQAAMQDIMDRCMKVVHNTLDGARTSASDINSVLLIGGPTQMPVFRDALESRFGRRLDLSQDPMTVVARGAAIFASSIDQRIHEKKHGAVLGAASVKLSYDKTCGTLQANLAGVVEDEASGIQEVCIDTESSIWSSGWIPVIEGLFETTLRIQNGTTTRFIMSARDRQGKPINVHPNTFSIRHGLEIAKPPLPHNILVELEEADGRNSYETIFNRGVSLPAEVTKTFSAARPLSPSDTKSSLVIKLWEQLTTDNAEETVWVGRIDICARDIRRPIPAGAPLEITFKIDKSRRITVAAFAPHLNQHFEGNVYVPDEHSTTENAEDLIEKNRSLANDVVDIVRNSGDEEDWTIVQRLQQQNEQLDETILARSFHESQPDPEENIRSKEEAKRIRRELNQIKKQVADGKIPLSLNEAAEAAVSAAQHVVDEHGTVYEQQEFAAVQNELRLSLSTANERSVKRTIDKIDSLRWRILLRQDEVWVEQLKLLKFGDYTRVAESRELMQQGEVAVQAGDMETVRKTVRKLLELRRPDELDADLRSGLKLYRK